MSAVQQFRRLSRVIGSDIQNSSTRRDATNGDEEDTPCTAAGAAPPAPPSGSCRLRLDVRMGYFVFCSESTPLTELLLISASCSSSPFPCPLTLQIYRRLALANVIEPCRTISQRQEVQKDLRNYFTRSRRSVVNSAICAAAPCRHWGH